MASYPLYNSTTTSSWGTSTGIDDVGTWTTTATSSGGDIWVDTGTGGQVFRVRDPYGYHNNVIISGSTDTNVNKISEAVTKKDLKMIKDEVKKYMNDQMLKDAKEIAGKLFTDIEKLKKDKTQLKKEVTELKTSLKKAQADIEAELIKIEEVLERRAASIGKFRYLDFSKDESS